MTQQTLAPPADNKAVPQAGSAHATQLEPLAGRHSDLPVAPVFLDRWSPRSLDRSRMPDRHLSTILEAGRWAPSAFNVQPWRFIYAHRGDSAWDLFTSFPDAFNQTWADSASSLVVLLSDRVMPSRDPEHPGHPSRYNSFDAGAAWAQIALQATILGYHAHAMAGIDQAALRRELNIPERYRVEIMIAIGRRDTPAHLPEELQEQETPNTRRPLDEVAFAGAFPA
jgi:nitroreductase